MADDGGQGELFNKGLAMRRAVLGAEYVDRSIANADAFTQPLQKLVTEWCWGEVWNRPGLDEGPETDRRFRAWLAALIQGRTLPL